MPVSSIHPKVAATGVAGAATIIIIYILSLFGIDPPDVVASAITAILTFLAGYITKDNKTEREMSVLNYAASAIHQPPKSR